MQSMTSSSIPTGLLTDVGRQRAGGVNQDAAVVVELPNGGLYAVADGMGGHAAGELAANLALDTLTQAFMDGRGSPPERLAEAVQAANLAVLQHAVGESVGMGTTLMAALIDKGAVLLAQVGDSRAYLLRGGELFRLTEDHSWVAEQVRLGFLTEEEARNHQWKSVVNNALGGEERVRLELFGLPIKAGDRLLLCSDGLSGVVEETDLLRLMSRQESPEQLVQRLINAANDAGGPDNITAIVLDIPSNQPLPRYSLPERSPEGPEYVDLLLNARRGTGMMTYAVLSLIYFTLLGIMLFPERRAVIAVLGLFTILGTYFGERYYKRKRQGHKPATSGPGIRRTGRLDPQTGK